MPLPALPPSQLRELIVLMGTRQHCNIDENLVKALADTFLANGMAAAGYRYVNIDDCWQVDPPPECC